MPKVGMEPVRRAAIIRAAQECVAELGFEKTTMIDIARKAECSTGTVNHYFQNREDVLVTALRAASWAVGRRMRQVLAETNNPWRRLDRLIALSLPDSPSDRREWYITLTLWNEARHNDKLRRLDETRFNGWYNLIQSIIEDGITQGVFRPLDSAQITLTVIGLINGLAVPTLLGQPRVNSEQMRLVCSQALRTLLATS